MKKLKETLRIILIVVVISSTIFGVGYLKYRMWRVEHPQAKTWTFFVTKSR